MSLRELELNAAKRLNPVDQIEKLLNINESLDFLLNQIIINMEQNLGVKGKVRSGSRLYDGTPNTKKKNCC